MYTIYINNTLPPALAVHEIYRDIFGPPMNILVRITTFSSQESWCGRVTRRGGLGSNEETRTSKYSNASSNDLQQVSAERPGHESVDNRLKLVRNQ